MNSEGHMKKWLLLTRTTRKWWFLQTSLARRRATARRRRRMYAAISMLVGFVVLFTCIVIPCILGMYEESLLRPFKKRRWTLDRTTGGFWEAQVLKWPRASWDEKYVQYFRVDYKTFRCIVQRYGKCLVKEDPQDRRFLPCSREKRVAIVLNWLATGDTQRDLEAK